jgi:hypothetical protein
MDSRIWGPKMDEEIRSAQNDRFAHRMNQMLSGIVACAVLGVAGVAAYQNRDSLKVPDRNAAWSGFWTKKLSKGPTFPTSGLPEFKAPDWEKNGFIDSSNLMSQQFQFSPSQSSNTSSSSSSRRRHP